MKNERRKPNQFIFFWLNFRRLLNSCSEKQPSKHWTNDKKQTKQKQLNQNKVFSFFFLSFFIVFNRLAVI